MASRVIFECPVCSQAVTRPLEPLPETILICHEDGQTAIPAGYFRLSDEGWWTGSTGGMLVNLSDLIQVSYHPDLRRHSGCCGRDGCDGPNLVCQKGHEIGTERSDCWMSHAAVLLPSIMQREHNDPSPALQPASRNMTYPKKALCPCCRFPTLNENHGWEICLICWWEDDGQSDKDADQAPGGPNGRYSLTAARKNFSDHGHMYDPGHGIDVVEHPSDARLEMMEILQSINFDPQQVDSTFWKLLELEDRAIRNA